MHTFLRSFNTFTHISDTLLLQKSAAVLKKIPVTAPSFHASTHFHIETPSNIMIIFNNHPAKSRGPISPDT